MKHAFFADMGGFILETGDEVSIPLTAKQLHYLVVEGYISEARVTTEVISDKNVIEDKNKTDTVVRIITIAQTLWFIINCLGRAIQHLAITTLELTTLGFVATTIGVSLFWAHKPADIKIAQILKIDVTVNAIRSKAGIVALDNWFRTPLEFVDPKQDYFAIFWIYNVNILRKLHVVSERRHRPITSIRDDNFPEISFRNGYLWMAIPFGAVSCAIIFAGWNFWFPSPIERILWRISSLIFGGTLVCGVVYQFYLDVVEPWLQNYTWFRFTIKFQRPVWPGSKKLSSRSKNIAATLRNITADKDPAFSLPLKILFPAIFCASLYSFARLYILVEDVVSLRSLPPSAYETVDWTQFLPHV